MQLPAINPIKKITKHFSEIGHRLDAGESISEKEVDQLFTEYLELQMKAEVVANSRYGAPYRKQIEDFDEKSKAMTAILRNIFDDRTTISLENGFYKKIDMGEKPK